MPLKGYLYRKAKSWKEERKLKKAQEREAKGIYKREYLRQRGPALIKRAKAKARRQIKYEYDLKENDRNGLSSRKFFGGIKKIGGGISKASDWAEESVRKSKHKGGFWAGNQDEAVLGGFNGIGSSDAEVLGFGYPPQRRRKRKKIKSRRKKRRRR